MREDEETLPAPDEEETTDKPGEDNDENDDSLAPEEPKE